MEITQYEEDESRIYSSTSEISHLVEGIMTEVEEEEADPRESGWLADYLEFLTDQLEGFTHAIKMRRMQLTDFLPPNDGGAN